MRHLGQLRGILLCFLGGLGFGLLLCRFMGFRPAGGLVMALSGLLGGFLGCLSLGRRQMFAGAALTVGAVCAALLGGLWFRDVVMTLCMIAVSLLTSGALVASGYSFCGSLGCWSTVLLGAALLCAGDFPGLWRGALNLCVIAALGLTLDGFRENSLRKSQHLDRGMPRRNSFDLTGRSLKLFALFLGISVLAATLGYLVVVLLSGGASLLWAQLRETAGTLYAWLEVWVDRFLVWFWSLFTKADPESGERIQVDGGGKPLPGIVAAASTVALILFLVGCAVLFAGTLLVVRAIVRPRLKPSQQTPDYVDEVETLERPKRRLFGRRDRRRPRMSDYQGAMKIRFAFQQLLRKRMETDALSRTKTPNELREPDQADQNILIDAYNRVRYGGGGATEAEIAAAERFLKKN